MYKLLSTKQSKLLATKSQNCCFLWSAFAKSMAKRPKKKISKTKLKIKFTPVKWNWRWINDGSMFRCWQQIRYKIDNICWIWCLKKSFAQAQSSKRIDVTIFAHYRQIESTLGKFCLLQSHRIVHHIMPNYPQWNSRSVNKCSSNIEFTFSENATQQLTRTAWCSVLPLDAVSIKV